ncbi:MAG: MATE family efflux transporter [Treponemataceae bacterium]
MAVFSMQKSYQIDITHGSTLKNILLFSLPLMGSGILQLLFNSADVVIVGRFAGDESLAAVGSTSSLINLIINLFIGFSIGANVIVAKEFGAKNERGTENAVHTAMLLSVFSGIFLTIIGVFFTKYILSWMHSPPQVLPLASSYLKFYFLGITAIMVYNFGAAILRAIGDTRRPLVFLFFAGILNVVLNLIFVICFHLGVIGVGLATSISQLFAAICIVICLVKESSYVRLDFHKLHINRTKLIQIVKMGLPAGFQGMLFSFSNVVIQSGINTFGPITIAGNSAAMNVEHFVYISMNAFHQAAMTFGSQSFGAKNSKLILKVTFTSLVCVIVVGLLLGNLMTFFAEPILSIFTKGENSAQVIAAGKTRLLIITSTYALCGIMEVMVGSLRAIGYSVMPMVVSFIGACGLRLLWMASVWQFPKWHNTFVIYLSYPVSWLLTSFVHIICYILGYKKATKNK